MRIMLSIENVAVLAAEVEVSLASGLEVDIEGEPATDSLDSTNAWGL